MTGEIVSTGLVLSTEALAKTFPKWFQSVTSWSNQVFRRKAWNEWRQANAHLYWESVPRTMPNGKQGYLFIILDPQRPDAKDVRRRCFEKISEHYAK